MKDTEYAELKVKSDGWQSIAEDLQQEILSLRNGLSMAHSQLEAIEALLNDEDIPIEVLSFGAVQRVSDALQQFKIMRDGWGQK